MTECFVCLLLLLLFVYLNQFQANEKGNQSPVTSAPGLEGAGRLRNQGPPGQLFLVCLTDFSARIQQENSLKTPQCLPSPVISRASPVSQWSPSDRWIPSSQNAYSSGPEGPVSAHKPAPHCVLAAASSILSSTSFLLSLIYDFSRKAVSGLSHFPAQLFLCCLVPK